MQKKDPTYKDVKEDTAWNMDKFNEYINSHYSAQMGIEENWTFNTLTVSVMIRFRSPKKSIHCKIPCLSREGCLHTPMNNCFAIFHLHSIDSQYSLLYFLSRQLLFF